MKEIGCYLKMTGHGIVLCLAILLFKVLVFIDRHITFGEKERTRFELSLAEKMNARMWRVTELIKEAGDEEWYRNFLPKVVQSEFALAMFKESAKATYDI